MKIYFDTNIIIDVLKRREPFYENTKDFSKSSIQAVTPDVFLANVKL